MKAQLPEQRTEAPGADPTDAERELLERYIEHTETPNPEALKQVFSDDALLDAAAARTLGGARQVVGSWSRAASARDVRLDALRGHPRQPPAACYVRRPGDDAHTARIDVLRIAGGAVAEIVTFDGSLFGMFDLPGKI